MSDRELNVVYVKFCDTRPAVAVLILHSVYTSKSKQDIKHDLQQAIKGSVPTGRKPYIFALLAQLARVQGVPSMQWYGTGDRCKLMVMDLLDIRSRVQQQVLSLLEAMIWTKEEV